MGITFRPRIFSPRGLMCAMYPKCISNVQSVPQREPRPPNETRKLRMGLLRLRRTRSVNRPAPEEDDGYAKQTHGQRRKNPPAPVIGKEEIVVVLR